MDEMDFRWSRWESSQLCAYFRVGRVRLEQVIREVVDIESEGYSGHYVWVRLKFQVEALVVGFPSSRRDNH